MMDWMDKQPAVVRAGSVMCPDGQHECKDGQTCCKLASGQWGCCPIPEVIGVCFMFKIEEFQDP